MNNDDITRIPRAELFSKLRLSSPCQPASLQGNVIVLLDYTGITMLSYKSKHPLCHMQCVASLSPAFVPCPKEVCRMNRGLYADVQSTKCNAVWLKMVDLLSASDTTWIVDCLECHNESSLDNATYAIAVA